MSAAVLSPLGTMSCDPTEYPQEEEALSDFAPLFDINDNDEPMKDIGDNDESVPDLSDDYEMDTATTTTLEQSENTPAVFGGLSNLGNTCYLNSAVQMLASLDDLRLDGVEPEVESELHKHFVDVLTKLSRGETVNPVEFKQAIDAQSPLFLGYRQQDSHEFATTLLDLLDAAYKKKATDDDNMEETKEEASEEVEEDETDNEEQREDPAAANNDERTSPPAMPERRSLLSGVLPCRRSLSELQNDDISQLLHGGSSSDTVKEPKEEDATVVPQCKLIGGRAAVPTSGLTRFTPVDAAPDEQASTVPDSTLRSEQGQAPQENQEPTPIEEYFTTEVRAQLTCDSCKFTRSHVEKYLHLSLDIGSDSGSVEEGLRKFFAPEHREIKCEKCFGERATQTLEISKLPRALLIHCKRFIVDVSADYSRISYRKNQSPFSFNDSLSASRNGIFGEFLASNADIPRDNEEATWSLRDGDDDDMGVSSERSYRIRSVVNHIGSSASCGHYTCDAQRAYPNGERQWTRFNDSRVSEASRDDAMGDSAQRTAYMVMYELE